jgi:hypothetical protein
MNPADLLQWKAANQAYLAASLAIVRDALARYVAQEQGQPEPTEQQQDLQAALQQAADDLPSPSALENVCQAFNLSTFERDVLLLCAGLELDADFVALCSSVQGDMRRPHATFSLALATLPAGHWDALLPTAPLRHWRLVEVTAQEVMTLSPLRIDERILHYLTGDSYLDPRLRGLVEAVPVPQALPPSQQRLVDRITQLWGRRQAETTWTAVQLCGQDSPDKTAIAVMACAQFGLRLQVLRAAELSASLAEREALIPLWEREALLTNSALLLDCESLDRAETGRAVWLVERLQGPLLVASREPLRLRERILVRLDVTKPSAAEQQDLWQAELGPLAVDMNGQIAPLVMQFNLSPQAIRAACLDFQVQNQPYTQAEGQSEILNSQFFMFNSLWDACRSQSRPRLEDLAQRIEPAATWDELVLPELQKRTLREMAAHVRQRATVYDTWGFSSKGARGLGISALFAGMSGTGKTMAAEVLARELRLDLYRIDLSSVVSKYIGETEKNLRRVFDAAETGGAILLFDEADALFGKRSEVKDSHDRYANIEVSYLLQRMEAYRGLAILTTNLKEALDTAFLRRIRFVVQFPFPDAAQRTEIWRRIFPEATPREGLDVETLGRLNVAGGNIRNIALNAAFLAADAGEGVQMKHLLAAAQSEYTKLEKSLTDAEVEDWV